MGAWKEERKAPREGYEEAKADRKGGSRKNQTGLSLTDTSSLICIMLNCTTVYEQGPTEPAGWVSLHSKASSMNSSSICLEFSTSLPTLLQVLALGNGSVNKHKRLSQYKYSLEAVEGCV